MRDAKFDLLQAALNHYQQMEVRRRVREVLEPSLGQTLAHIRASGQKTVPVVVDFSCNTPHVAPEPAPEQTAPHESAGSDRT